MAHVRILFVCMGNICRSPTAEGVFAGLLAAEGLTEVIEIDSAGTHAYHVGKAPDRRAREAAGRRGYALEHLRGRQVEAADFERFDYVVAMDEDNRLDLLQIAPPGSEGRIRLLMDFAPDAPEREVPDPYYGAANGFEYVLDLVESATRGLLEHLRREHGLARREPTEP